jgi:hypothetical protein
MLMVLVSRAIIVVKSKLNDMGSELKETQCRESLAIGLLNSDSISRGLMTLISS